MFFFPDSQRLLWHTINCVFFSRSAIVRAPSLVFCPFRSRGVSFYANRFEALASKWNTFRVDGVVFRLVNVFQKCKMHKESSHASKGTWVDTQKGPAAEWMRNSNKTNNERKKAIKTLASSLPQFQKREIRCVNSRSHDCNTTAATTNESNNNYSEA